MCNYFTDKHIESKLTISVINHMQKQVKSSKPKQFYDHFPRIYRTALVLLNKRTKYCIF